MKPPFWLERPYSGSVFETSPYPDTVAAAPIVIAVAARLTWARTIAACGGSFGLGLALALFPVFDAISVDFGFRLAWGLRVAKPIIARRPICIRRTGRTVKTIAGACRVSSGTT